MDISGLTRNIFALVITAAVSSGVTYWYCHSNYDEERLTLLDKISILEKNERNAIVNKRISEQMGDIAYQSKQIADSARQKAEFESHKAMEQAQRAEQERRNALLAKDQADKAEIIAREQAAKAEQESKAAELARDEAVAARAKADTLRYISLGHSLAQSSLTQFNAGNTDLARLLSYAGYKYTTDYGGDPYQQDVFTSLLYNARNSRNQVIQLTGAVEDIACLYFDRNRDTDDADMVVLTDYGEIALLAPKPLENGMWQGFSSKILLNDNKYIFHDMCVLDSMIYALDVEGRLVVLNAYKGEHQKLKVLNVANSTRDAERWFKLLKKKDGNLIAVGEHQTSWINTKTGEVYRQRYIPETITEAGIGDGKLIEFCKKGKYYVYHEGEPVEWKLDLPKDLYVTSYYYHKNKHYHALGLDNGNIIFFNNDGNRVSEFTGHTGPITNMEHQDWCFVSSSYDKTIRIWNLDDIGGLVVSLGLECKSWPLTIEIDEKVNTLRVGYANGAVESVRINVNDNSRSVRSNLRREFTPEEWNYYIGRDEPYRTFMKK